MKDGNETVATTESKYDAYKDNTNVKDISTLIKQRSSISLNKVQNLKSVLSKRSQSAAIFDEVRMKKDNAREVV